MIFFYLRLPRMLKLIGLSTVTAVSMFLFNPGSALAQIVFATQEITNFQVVVGQSRWQQRAIQRLQGATWQFNPNGTFIFAPTNARSDLYPLQGNYQQQGNKIIFEGSSTSLVSTVAYNNAQIRGQIDFGVNPPVMTMSWGSKGTMSARVNNTQFGPTTNVSEYHATVFPRKIK